MSNPFGFDPLRSLPDMEPSKERELEEQVRETCLRACPDLYGHLVDLERLAEPFFGAVPTIRESLEDYDDE